LVVDGVFGNLATSPAASHAEHQLASTRDDDDDEQFLEFPSHVGRRADAFVKNVSFLEETANLEITQYLLIIPVCSILKIEFEPFIFDKKM